MKKKTFEGDIITDKHGHKYIVGVQATSNEEFVNILETYEYCMFNGTIFRTKDLGAKVSNSPILLLKYEDCYVLNNY